MMRLEWKVFISSKPCRLIVVPRQEFIKHMFGKLLFFFVFPKLGISYKAKKDPENAVAFFGSFPAYMLKQRQADIRGSLLRPSRNICADRSLSTRPDTPS